MATTTITRNTSANNNIAYYGENDPVRKVLEYLNVVSDIEQAEDAAAFIIMKKAEEIGFENPNCDDFTEVIETFSIMLENCRKARKEYKENRFEISDLENKIRNLESELFEARCKLQEITRERTTVISKNKKAATAFLIFESKIESFIKIQKERQEEIEKHEIEQKQKKREQLFSILSENPDLLEEVKKEFDISSRDVHVEISDGGDYQLDTNKWLIYATHIRDVLNCNSLPNLDLIKELVNDSEGYKQSELRKLMHFNSNTQISKFNKLILDPLKLGHLGRKNATPIKSCTNTRRRKRVYTKQYKLEVLNEFIEDNK